VRFVIFFAVCSLQAQLIPPGQPIPRTTAPPVVFLNGFELNCPGSSFSNRFGIADQILQSAGRVSLFFNYCVVITPTASIEDLGDSFQAFLAGLKYTDGQPVDQVDCVAYSMGGLILRSYLSGKRSTPGTFNPPLVTHIRKVVFLATPHFGTGIPVALPFSTTVISELASGSRFLFDLATWNQNTDDLRGVDAVTAIGNGGTGQATTPGFDDGVAALTSASLGFYAPGRTRVVPFCHTDGSGLIGFAGFCNSNANGIAHIDSPAHPTARIIVSFLAGTTDWQNAGVAAEQDPLLSKNGGLDVMMRDSNDSPANIDSVTASSPAQTKSLNRAEVAYTDMFAAGPMTLTGTAGSIRASAQLTLPATVYRAYVLKPGPLITGVAPGAAKVSPLSVAPGSIISIYGNALDNARVTVNGTALQIYSASAGLINAVMPDVSPGLTKLAVQNGGGNNTVNLFVEPAVPAIFTTDQSGTGAAAAVDDNTGLLVDAAHPLRAGDYLSLYLTGLGATTIVNGLAVANIQPSVTIAGQNCPVTYGGRVPGIAGLDQINCVVPSGIGPGSAARVVVVSGTRASNVVTVAIE
jgi:uncharacterized protein (TIGR03437 family)